MQPIKLQAGTHFSTQITRHTMCLWYSIAVRSRYHFCRGKAVLHVVGGRLEENDMYSSLMYCCFKLGLWKCVSQPSSISVSPYTTWSRYIFPPFQFVMHSRSLISTPEMHKIISMCRWPRHTLMQGCTIPYHVVAMANEFKLLNPTGHYMFHKFNIQQLYALPTLYLCFVFIWEQKATCATYSTNWLVL